MTAPNLYCKYADKYESYLSGNYNFKAGKR